MSVANIVRPSTSGAGRSGRSLRPLTSAGAGPSVASMAESEMTTLLNQPTGNVRTFPIDISLPREVVVGGQHVKLPETFVEKRTPVSVQYELTITLSRGALRSVQQIRTSIVYVPITRPGPPSLVRELAEEQGLLVPGPADDPGGWISCAPTIVKGKVFKSRKVQIQCTLSLAKPLAYTRGSALPVAVEFRSGDAQALDLLAAPGAIPLRLRRHVRYWAPPASRPREVAWSEVVDDLATATWWHEVGPAPSGTRRLAGEILLPRDLAPTGGVHTFSVKYSVVLLPFEATGFVAKRPDTIAVSETVEITTKHPRGHGARQQQQPPAYE
uniref:Expressed protein n=2 Tax=Schizophyllum commune (strain H4-8 / FGSC 9210) TaxID=578458 RepID=D8Q435_SCHCM